MNARTQCMQHGGHTYNFAQQHDVLATHDVYTALNVAVRIPHIHTLHSALQY